MLIESFEHAEADFEARLLIDARNEAETVINATEKSLRRPDFDRIAAEALEPGERDRIDAALADARLAMMSTSRDEIHQKTEALNHATSAPGGSGYEPKRARGACGQERKGRLNADAEGYLHQ